MCMLIIILTESCFFHCRLMISIIIVVVFCPICKILIKMFTFFSFTGIMCIMFFLCSFPFVLGNGIYLFQLFDQFAGTLPLLFIGFCEVATIAYVFGVKRFI